MVGVMTDAPTGPVPIGPAPIGALTSSRHRSRTVLVIVVLWTLLIGGLALAVGKNGRATAPEQASLTTTLRLADTATGDVVSAIDPATAVIDIEGYQRAETSCRITAARSGTVLQRTVRAYPTPGEERDLLSAVAHGLPARYSPRLSAPGTKPVLTAMDRSYIGIRGTVDGPGQVRIDLNTGCRPGAVPPIAPADSDRAPQAARAAVQAAVDRLHLAPTEWASYSAPCRAGGRMWTVSATATAAATQLSPQGIPRSGTTVVMDQPAVVVFRAEGAGTVLLKNDDRVTVTASLPTCQ
jgi:hypothetical protein